MPQNCDQYSGRTCAGPIAPTGDTTFFRNELSVRTSPASNSGASCWREAASRIQGENSSATVCLTPKTALTRVANSCTSDCQGCTRSFHSGSAMEVVSWPLAGDSDPIIKAITKAQLSKPSWILSTVPAISLAASAEASAPDPRAAAGSTNTDWRAVLIT